MTTKNGILFFDLDGTVADSGAGILASMNHVLESRHLQPLTSEDLTHFVGPPLSVSFPIVFAPRGVPAEEMHMFIEEYRAIYGATYLPQTPLNPGMGDALTELKNSWRLAIVTSKPEPQALIALQATGVRHYFDVVVGPHDDSEIPKAQLLERALHEMNELHGELPPLTSCWMIGDRHHDIDAGVEVGTHSAGVLWGFGTPEELSSAGATVIVKTPPELVAILNN